MEDSIQMVQDTITTLLQDSSAIAEAANNATGVTPKIWLITGLGFGMVLVLLFVFVYIMKGLGWIMQPHKTAQPTPSDEPTKAAIATSIALAQSDDDEAAVAYALHLYYHAHDVEPPHLTLHAHHSMWNNNL